MGSCSRGRRSLISFQCHRYRFAAGAYLGRVGGVQSASPQARSMKQKYEGKELQGLVELGREQGYLTFDQVNDFLPQEVSSPTDLRSALESFQDMDIKVLDDGASRPNGGGI